MTRRFADAGESPTSEQPDRSLTLWTGDIVDRFSGLFLVPFAPARPGRREGAQRFGAAIDASQWQIGERDDPVAGLGLGDADGLADQCLAEKDEIAAPPDLAIRAHAPHGVCGIVVRFFQALGIGAHARPVAAGRGLLAECLVRPLMVVGGAEAVEALLLGGERGGRRRRRLGVERGVPALMPAVLLRPSRIGALAPDAPPDPPHPPPRE